MNGNRLVSIFLTKFFPSPRAILSSGLVWLAFSAGAATTVPMEVRMPGTQPEDGVNLNLSSNCDQCHQDSSAGVNIVQHWRGSMMSHAGRDPIYWATVAIAEQDFDGSGDLCLRCHTMSGWLGGESTPTDGSTLATANAAEGVGCEVCHVMTNPDDTEHVGVQNSPFIANDGGMPVEGHYGSAQLSMWGGPERFGPYADANARHQWDQSLFHRSVDFCGSCHDVSNPVVGDLAPNNGAQQPLDPGTFDGQLDTPTNPRIITDKAAFNNPPYRYGVVERTYSEYKAGLLSSTRVAITADTGDVDYGDLPAELQDGLIQIAYDNAQLAGNGGDYADNTPRYFSCQTCHMTATTALGCNKNNVQLRTDQPMHDLTGGNYWMPDAIQYMDAQNTLLAGGDLSALENTGIAAGKQRAMNNLDNAASLSVDGNTLRVVNLTGHKLISGYPEGRRMWLNIVWKDAAGATVREDGAYGQLSVSFDVNGDGNVDAGDTVETLLDLHDSNTKVYEAHGAITQEWASKLIAVSAAYTAVPVAYDRVTGAVTATVGDIAAQAPGTYHETFHFVLNNKVVKDNRIPPYGMAYDESLKRSILPVPETQYGNPASGGVYNYWDDFALNPPNGAVSADISLMYQPTSWEYIQFLDHANNGSVAFLANEGANMLDAWLNTGMAAPHVMASTTWTAPATDTDGDGVPDDTDNCTLIPNPTQCDGDADGYGNHCDADFNQDGIVNGLDIGPFKAGFGTVDPVTDLNCDGITNGLDVGPIKAMFGFPPGPSGLHP